MFWKVRSQKGSREIKKNEVEIALTLYIEILFSRWIERHRELLRIKIARNSYRVAIEELTRGVHSKRGSMDREAIEHVSSI